MRAAFEVVAETALVVALFAGIPVQVADAQVAARVLTVESQETTGGGALLTISFAGSLPNATPPSSSGRASLISFSPATLGGETQWTGSGNLKSIEASQRGPAVLFRLVLNGPAPVAVNASGNRYFIVIGSEAGRAGAPQQREHLAKAVEQPIAPQVRNSGVAPELVRLKYADVSEVAALLSTVSVAPNDVFQGQFINFNSGGVQSGVASGAPSMSSGPSFTSNPNASQTPTAQRLTDSIFIDRRLNAIVLAGTAEENKRAKALIETVDVPLPVILVQSEVVELTERAAKDLGIAYGSNGVLATGRLQGQSLQVGQGETSLQASIYAQVQRGQGRIVTRPSVIAQSGTFASILTGDSIPISTTITYPGPTPVIQQQIQYISVGVGLQIQPRLTSDNMILCHILSQVSTVTQYVQGYPQISQRTAATTAMVQAGQPLVIGGLVQENEIWNLEKIPGLGDLPLIGSFFRVRHESRQRTNLYIITTMTPVDTTNGRSAN